MAAAGCRTGRGESDVAAVVRPEPDLPAPPPPVAVEPAPTPEPPLTGTLERADLAYESGDLESALGEYRSYLEERVAGEGAAGGVAADPAVEDGGEEVDRAIYRLAVLHLLSGGPARDRAAGYSLLRRLVREYPDSPYRYEAGVILGLSARVDGLLTEVERLEGQLEALKRIDLDRPPDRAPP